MVYSKMLSYGHLMVHKQEHHTERERERERSVTVSTDYFHQILNDYRCQSKKKNRSSYKVYAMIVLFWGRFSYLIKKSLKVCPCILQNSISKKRERLEVAKDPYNSQVQSLMIKMHFQVYDVYIDYAFSTLQYDE